MRTIERNYRKNPHTARFLMAFHAGTDGLPSDIEGDGGATDLLDLVPDAAPAYAPSPKQVAFIDDMIREIEAIFPEAGKDAKDYTVKMIGHWTRENLSRWIDRLKTKRAEARAAAKWPASLTISQAPAPAAPEVADGRYAVEENGVLKFFRVKNGRRAGMVFLDIQASDDWHSIRDMARLRAVLALIAIDARAAMVRYGHELGECGRCGRTLTDEASRAAGIGPICASK